MPDQYILQECLIHLNYSVDYQQYQNFHSSIQRTDKAFQKLDLDMLGAIESIGLMIDSTTRKLNNMYLQSQATGTPVKSIDQLRQNFKMVGLSAEDADQAISGMFETFAQRGGIGGGFEQALMQGIGYKGDMADMKSVFEAYIKYLSTLPKTIRDIQGHAQMGFSAEFIEKMVANLPLMEQTEKRRAQIMKEMGVNLDEKDPNSVTSRARGLGIAIANLEGTWDAFLDMLEGKWVGDATSLVTKLDDIIQTIGKWMSGQSNLTVEIETGIAAMAGFGVTLGVFRTALAAIGFGKAASELGGFTFGLGTLEKMLANILKTLGMMAGMRGILAALFPWASFLLGMSPIETGHEAPTVGQIGGEDETWDQTKARLKAAGYSDDDIAQYGRKHPELMAKQQQPPAATGDVMGYFQSQGWTKAQAAAITANLARESGLHSRQVGDNGLAFGLAQWHPDRQADFAGQFGHSITESTLQEQLAFVQYELTKGKYAEIGGMLKGMNDPRSAAALLSTRYEKPAAAMPEALARANLASQMYDANAASNVTLHQQTDVTVNSTGDPKSTAMAVAEQQDRVNGNIVRQFKNKAH